ncbi:fungal-specific transcription factor domain-containing protein [Aspergillus filifer]
MSSPDQPVQSPTQPVRGLGKRAKIACKSCHRRRVKCDAAEVRPCWQCRLRGMHCELIETRRGKKKPAAARASNIVPCTPTSTESNRGAGLPTSHTAHKEPCSPVQPPSSRQASSPPPSSSILPESVIERYEASEGPEMLYARLAETGPDVASPGFSTGNVRSYYMGDSFSLAFIVRALSAPSTELKLHYPIPNHVAEHALDAAEGLKDSNPATLAYLDMHGAFTLPPQDVSDELVRLFFECVHPAYPVFDRQEFCSLYRYRKSSLLVQHTIYFLSSIVCSEDTLKRAGFIDRYSARRAFYLRAKALYDMDYEKSKEKLTAVLFLLGFWWEGPEDQKDTWHWLGAAIGLAQTLGMHRSYVVVGLILRRTGWDLTLTRTASAGMSSRQRSIWKRIWWSIYIRDRHAAASLGRPCRINDEDCDVEMLGMDDFLVDHEVDREVVSTEYQYQRNYVIEMARLAIILGMLLNHEFAPRKAAHKSITTDSLNQYLCDWERDLPRELRRAPVDETLGAPFWSCMLYASYHHCQILLFRLRESGSVSERAASFHRRARAAADSTTRIVEDLLAAGTLGSGQLHLVPAIFAALSIHALVIRSSDLIQKQLAENRARQCILGMSELAKGWPVAGWILRLFINLMKRLTETGSYAAGPPQLLERASNTDLHLGQQSINPVQSTENPASYAAGNGGQSLVANSGSICDDGRESFGLVEVDQLMSDIMRAPDQNDFDLMLNSHLASSLFPPNLEFLQGSNRLF